MFSIISFASGLVSLAAAALKFLFGWAIYRAGETAQIKKDQAVENSAKTAELQAEVDAPGTQAEAADALKKGTF